MGLLLLINKSYIVNGLLCAGFGSIQLGFGSLAIVEALP